MHQRKQHGAEHADEQTDEQIADRTLRIMDAICPIVRSTFAAAVDGKHPHRRPVEVVLPRQQKT